MSGNEEMRRLRLEVRAQQEEAEAAVAEQDAAARTMNDILGDLGRLGVPVAIDIPGRQIHGLIIHVGKEVTRLETPGGDNFDIAIGAIGGVRSSGESRSVVTIGKGHPDSMIARLRELAVTQERVTLARYHGGELVGTLLVAGINHVQLEDNQRKMWFIPSGSVAWVGPPF